MVIDISVVEEHFLPHTWPVVWGESLVPGECLVPCQSIFYLIALASIDDQFSFVILKIDFAFCYIHFSLKGLYLLIGVQL